MWATFFIQVHSHNSCSSLLSHRTIIPKPKEICTTLPPWCFSLLHVFQHFHHTRGYNRIFPSNDIAFTCGDENNLKQEDFPLGIRIVLKCLIINFLLPKGVWKKKVRGRFLQNASLKNGRDLEARKEPLTRFSIRNLDQAIVLKVS